MIWLIERASSSCCAIQQFSIDPSFRKKKTSRKCVHYALSACHFKSPCMDSYRLDTPKIANTKSVKNFKRVSPICNYCDAKKQVFAQLVVLSNKLLRLYLETDRDKIVARIHYNTRFFLVPTVLYI